jgi:UDP:flavonoid glycosyltransferase YjiC (YdhE family)
MEVAAMSSPPSLSGRELLRWGHDVCMAVPPNLVGFAEAAGLATAAYRLDSQAILDTQRKYWTCYSRTPWKLKELNRMGRETAEFRLRFDARESPLD